LKDEGEKLDMESANKKLNAIHKQLEQGDFLRTASAITESARNIVQQLALLTTNLTAFNTILPTRFPLTQLVAIVNKCVIRFRIMGEVGRHWSFPPCRNCGKELLSGREPT
jgi:hypothetical protein